MPPIAALQGLFLFAIPMSAHKLTDRTLLFGQSAVLVIGTRRYRRFGGTASPYHRNFHPLQRTQFLSAGGDELTQRCTSTPMPRLLLSRDKPAFATAFTVRNQPVFEERLVVPHTEHCRVTRASSRLGRPVLSRDRLYRLDGKIAGTDARLSEPSSSSVDAVRSARRDAALYGPHVPPSDEEKIRAVAPTVVSEDLAPGAALARERNTCIGKVTPIACHRQR